MGLKKEILHNTYNEDDEKLPGRTVSIKTQEGGGPAVEYPIAVNKGGTGASTAAAARRNLGIGTVATENTVPVSKGGTGASNAAAACANIGAIPNAVNSLSNVNLDNYKTTGFYYITTNVTNAPVSWCWCIVVGGVGTAQIIITPGALHVRAYTGSPAAWTQWRHIDTVA